LLDNADEAVTIQENQRNDLHLVVGFDFVKKFEPSFFLFCLKKNCAHRKERHNGLQTQERQASVPTLSEQRAYPKA
jgi:hypothetical protein